MRASTWAYVGGAGGGAGIEVRLCPACFYNLAGHSHTAPQALPLCSGSGTGVYAYPCGPTLRPTCSCPIVGGVQTTCQAIVGPRGTIQIGDKNGGFCGVRRPLQPQLLQACLE